MKIITVFGTRPEAIKMAPVVRALANDPAFTQVVCVTGQHREMLDQVLEAFDIQPDIDLQIMKRGQNLHDLTAEILVAMRPILEKHTPDLVLVHGDTTTALAATLAAFYAGIPVAHVEAGMRTGDMSAPFPEEANRVLISRLATYHFAPTEQNVKNLLAEGVPADHICQTGNTVIDALLYTAAHVAGPTAELERQLDMETILRNKILLVTGHRRENFGEKFQAICRALLVLSQEHPDLEIVYPVHLNPNVREPVHTLLSGRPNIHLIEPLSYPSFVYLITNSFAILTDSGGIQEEGPSLGKPVLVMRDTTERPEAIAAGGVVMVGTDEATIRAQVNALLTDPVLYTRMSQVRYVYGDGSASQKIVAFLKKNRL